MSETQYPIRAPDFHARLVVEMGRSMTADDLTDYYADLLNLAFEMNRHLQTVESRILDLEDAQDRGT